MQECFKKPNFKYSNNDDFATVNAEFEKTKDIRDRIVYLFSQMDDLEVVGSFSYMFNITLNDESIKEDYFKYSFLKYVLYEIALYVLSEIVECHNYILFDKLISLVCIYAETPSYLVNSHFYFSIDSDQTVACNLKCFSTSDELKVIRELVSKRINHEICSLDGLITVDLILSEGAILHDYEYNGFLSIYVRAGQKRLPVLASLVRSEIKSKEGNNYYLFGFNDYDSLFNAISKARRTNLTLTSGIVK